MVAKVTSPSPGRKRTRKTDGKSTTPNKAQKTSAVEAEDVAAPPAAAAAAPAPAPAANGGGVGGFFRWGSGRGGAAASSDPPAPAGGGGQSGAAAFRAATAATSPAAKKTKAQKRAEAERRAKEWAEKRKAKKGDKKEAAAPAPEDSDDDEAAGVGAPAPKATATATADTSATAPPKSKAIILTRLVTLSFLVLSTLGLATLYSHERSLRILTETNLSQELRFLQAEVETYKTKLAESEKSRLADKRSAAEARKCSEDLRRERLERESSAVEFQKQIDACYAATNNKSD